MHSTSNMSTKQDIIRHDDTLLKDKKDREDTPTSEVCVSPPSPNSTDKKGSCNIVNLTTGKKKRCFNDGCNKKTSKIIGALLERIVFKNFNFLIAVLSSETDIFNNGVGSILRSTA